MFTKHWLFIDSCVERLEHLIIYTETRFLSQRYETKTLFWRGKERIKDATIVGCPSSRHSSGISNRADDILNLKLIETACVKSTRLTHVEGDKKETRLSLKRKVFTQVGSVSIVSPRMVDLSQRTKLCFG